MRAFFIAMFLMCLQVIVAHPLNTNTALRTIKKCELSPSALNHYHGLLFLHLNNFGEKRVVNLIKE